MEPETLVEEVNKRVSEIAKGKTGEIIEITPEKTETLLDEARRLNRENRETATSIKTAVDKFERIAAEITLSGKSLAGRPKELTEDEQRIEAINERTKKLTSAYIR